jgi:hypothetical protein
MPTYYDDINIYNDYYKHTRIKAATLSPAHGVAAGNALLKHAYSAQINSPACAEIN